LTGLAIVIATIVLVQHLSLKPQATHASIPPQEKPALPLPGILSIAVLRFANLGSDPQQDYFSDGISDQLINNLSRLPGLFVIARNSSFAYKGKPTKRSDIGKELGVKYGLEGSVHKEADKVRTGVELVDASTGTDKWTEQYNRPLKDILAVQDEIVDKVVTTLGLVLKLEEVEAPHQVGHFMGPPALKRLTICFAPRNTGFASAKTIMRRRASGSKKPSSQTRSRPRLTRSSRGHMRALYCSDGV
jgi:TolB-like protein